MAEIRQPNAAAPQLAVVTAQKFLSCSVPWLKPCWEGSSQSGPHVLAAGRTSGLVAQLYRFQRADGCRGSSGQRQPANTPGAGTGLCNTQCSKLLLQRKSHKFRQDTSSRRCYFQKPTTTTLKHLLHTQLLCQAQEASIQSRAAGTPWLPAEQTGSLQDETEAVHWSCLSSLSRRKQSISSSTFSSQSNKSSWVPTNCPYHTFLLRKDCSGHA